jgi:peptidoglycan hydrolase CwlO-like protein
MEEQILREILSEMKGLRQEVVATNKRLDNTNERLDTTIKRLDGLQASFVVLQQGLADVRYELKGIKDILAERVIWNNETITIDTTGGASIHGVIHKGEKK